MEKNGKRKGFGCVSILTFFLSIAFLAGWFVYWEAKHQGLDAVGELVGRIPLADDIRVGSRTIGSLTDALISTDGEELVYLVLFQNNLELRPGGGFIGSFGILRIRDGHVTDFAVHDTGIFDTRIPDTLEPPYPLRETIGVDAWKMRDSNWSPDFPTNARQAVEFYRMGGGEETFDGVVGITADVLSSFLSVTGPIRIPGFPGSYGPDDGIFDLEYQVEQGYLEQDIDFGERKSVLGILGAEILSRVRELPPQDLLRLFGVILEDLDRKDIQIVPSDPELASKVAAAGWDGAFDTGWTEDFIMVVDANLGAWKTDSVMERTFRYEVDFSGDVPRARLTVSYRHGGIERNFMLKDYRSFLRVYVPEGAWFRGITGGETEPVYGGFMGRRYVGTLTAVPFGGEGEVVFEYDLPREMTPESYDLKIARQSGMKDVPISVTIVGRDGSRTVRTGTLDGDFVLSEAEDAGK